MEEAAQGKKTHRKKYGSMLKGGPGSEMELNPMFKRINRLELLNEIGARFSPAKHPPRERN